MGDTPGLRRVDPSFVSYRPPVDSYSKDVQKEAKPLVDRDAKLNAFLRDKAKLPVSILEKFDVFQPADAIAGGPGTTVAKPKKEGGNQTIYRVELEAQLAEFFIKCDPTVVKLMLDNFDAYAHGVDAQGQKYWTANDTLAFAEDSNMGALPPSPEQIAKRKADAQKPLGDTRPKASWTDGISNFVQNLQHYGQGDPGR